MADPYWHWGADYDQAILSQYAQLERELKEEKAKNQMNSSPERIGRAERERYVEHLRNMYAEERITDDELNERLDKAFAAKFQQDLSALVTDLPAIPKPQAVALPKTSKKPSVWAGIGGWTLFVLLIAWALWGLVALFLV